MFSALKLIRANLAMEQRKRALRRAETPAVVEPDPPETLSAEDVAPATPEAEAPSDPRHPFPLDAAT